MDRAPWSEPFISTESVSLLSWTTIFLQQLRTSNHIGSRKGLLNSSYFSDTRGVLNCLQSATSLLNAIKSFIPDL